MNGIRGLSWWALLPVLLGPGLAAAPAPATLSVGAHGTPISPAAVNGFNVSYDMSVAEARSAVQSVAPSSLRYPPGNVGDEQDLTRAGLQSFQATLKLSAAPGEPPPLATVETRVFATRADAHNTPEDAAQAARDAQAIGLRPAYWEIGNEPDLYSKNRGDASWTPQRYCQVFRAQRAAILTVDAHARFAGPAVSNVSGDSVPGSGAAFLTAFVKDCGDVLDLLTWHEYPSRGELSDEDALATAPRVSEHLARFRALLDDPASNPHGAARHTGLGVSEYSLSYVSSKGRHLSDMVGALWAAETTLRLADGGAALSQYFALIGSGGHGLVDLAGVPRPALYAFQLTRGYQGEALPARSNVPGLWVHAARAGQTLTVLVSNTLISPQAISTALTGPTLDGATLSAASGFTAGDVDEERGVQQRPASPTLTLPARSMTRLTYTLPGPE